MQRAELKRLVDRAACRVLGWEDAGNDAHRRVLAALASGVDRGEVVVLCEPSLSRSTRRPPDVVLVCPLAGVVVVEVKGIGLDQVEGLEAGGLFRIRYDGGPKTSNPFAQVRAAMFDVKHAAERLAEGPLVLPFDYRVVLASIDRKDWTSRWGADAFAPPELLFADDVPDLAARLVEAGRRRLRDHGLDRWSDDELRLVLRAFGDDSVLFPAPENRPARRTAEGRLGHLFDELAEVHKALSDDQQRLSEQVWEHGPRLVRGVAGSGKTIVLANNAARRVERLLRREPSLFADAPEEPPRILAVCFNRSLVPSLERRIDVAFRQRTGSPLPEGIVDVASFNRLMYVLKERGVWRYASTDGTDEAARAAEYRAQLADLRERHPEFARSRCYDAVYVDEGQDFLEEEYRLLLDLCRRGEGEEPSLFLFYDDAQNLYARPRPNWSALGLNVLGRSSVMTDCFRNTRQVVEPAFNVLYGTFAEDRSALPTKAFGDVRTLTEKGLLAETDGRWEVRFARREGLPLRCTAAGSRPAEAAAIVERLRWLLGGQEVRPQDVLVLAWFAEDAGRLAEDLRRADLPGVAEVHDATRRKDEPFGRKGVLTVSTVHSAKGQDAYCVLFAGVDRIRPDVVGRAGFYVGCTRAIEYLELFGASDSGLLGEARRAAERAAGR